MRAAFVLPVALELQQVQEVNHRFVRRDIEVVAALRACAQFLHTLAAECVVACALHRVEEDVIAQWTCQTLFELGVGYLEFRSIR